MLTALLQEEELFKHLLSPPSPHSFLHAAPRPPPVFPRHVSSLANYFCKLKPSMHLGTANQIPSRQTIAIFRVDEMDHVAYQYN